MMAYREGRSTPAGRAGERGFTLFELLVSVVVAGLALLATMVIASHMGSQLHAERGQVSAQDNARVALDEVVRTLRGAGSQADQARGQGRFIYAGPWTIGLNANLSPAVDPNGTASPVALDPAKANATVPLAGGSSYTPPLAFGTGAETIVLTLDSNRDGSINTADAADNEEERSTDNPNDYVLDSFVYGNDGAKNTVTTTGLAVVRGPSTATDGTRPEPLFRYWIDDDHDGTTPPVLHGDTNGDGKLSQTEIAALGPVASRDLALIERIDVAATAENDKAKHSSENGWSVLRSTVSFRNFNTTAVRVTGVVFHDANRNGVRDSGEVPLPGVLVRTGSFSTKTNTDGAYTMVIPAVAGTLSEIDPIGYESTTPNNVAIHPAPGDYLQVNFGDVATRPAASIKGLVFNDVNKNGVVDKQTDKGIHGVRVFLDTGVQTYTDAYGKYAFQLTTGNFTITEVDSAGYGSSTPNVVNVSLAAAGDSAYVPFGDYLLKKPGTIQGIVYHDLDNDGVYKTNSEPGIPNVTISLQNGMTTLTDAAGKFKFVVDEGPYDVTETDPSNYTSSTVNTVSVTVVGYQTSTVNFGDIGQQDVNFQEIRLANTQRALSIMSADFTEDNKLDTDLVLGTHYVGGTNDILVWWNERKNSGTPNSAIFNQSPSVQRTVSADVNGVATSLIDNGGSADLVLGLGTTSNNITVWLTAGSGAPPNSPNQRYSTAMATGVNDVVVGRFDADVYPDLAVGTVTGPGTGRVEIWHGASAKNGTFTRADTDLYTTMAIPAPTLTLETLGEVISLAAADFNGDGKDDLVVGTRRSTTQSVVYLLQYGTPSLADTTGHALVVPLSSVTQPYFVRARFTVPSSLNDVVAADMKEDDHRDIDILVADQLTSTTGTVTEWLNRGNNHFGAGTTPDTQPSDSANPYGAALSMVVTKSDNDVFPDLVVGTRSTATYDGKVVLYRGFGYLPTNGQVISTTGVGEVITLTTADYNMDGAPDLAAGTRTSSTTGKVVVYYDQRSGGI